MKKYAHLPISSASTLYTRWAKIIKTRQVGNLFFLPHTGLLYRIYQFRDWYESKYGHISILDLDVELATDPHALTRALNKYHEPMILICRHNLLGPDGPALAESLQNSILDHRFGVILVHETSPLTLYNILDWPSVIMQNILVYSLPSLEQSAIYIDRLAGDWQLKLKPNISQDIVTICGNQLWLINELLRLYEANPSALLNGLCSTPSFQQKCEIIWNAFPKTYQQYFLDHPQNSKMRTKVHQEITEFNLNYPWLKSFIQQKKLETILIESDRICFAGQEISYRFSAGEIRILYLLNSHTIQPRQMIAQAFWQGETDNKYSDWALDQIIRRLRQKITQLQLPIYIQTKRGRGYVYSRSSI